MEQIEVEGKAGIMAAPCLKRAANKFHDLNVKWKKKAIVENQKAIVKIKQFCFKLNISRSTSMNFFAFSRKVNVFII